MSTGMELLEVSLTQLQRRNRAAFVHRSDIPGSPDLEPGHKVVLRDEVGDYFAGTVVDGVEERGDVRYLVHVGVRLPEEYALLRLGRTRGPDAPAYGADDGVQAVLDLMGEARESLGGRMPSQRLGGP